ncbi:MAG: cytochrome c biogenesis heme-transporting ATPase CcmA [Burkholderiales bacterium]|jgi:heme exporter protein A
MLNSGNAHLLELDAVECRRGEKRLFKRLSAQVESGMLLRVEGENGAGKTTLLRTLCGLSCPARGRVLWGGRSILEQREFYHRQLVYLGHTLGLKEDLSAIENLESGWSLSGAQPLAQGQAHEALCQSGLSGREHLPVKALSQGQRKRVALARLVLAADTPLWILDEPLNALDASATQWLLGLLIAHLECGGLIVLTSHQALPWRNAPRQLHITL